MVDEKALEDMKSSFSAMAESDIPEDVKIKIADRTGKVSSLPQKPLTLTVALLDGRSGTTCPKTIRQGNLRLRW